MVLLRTYVVFPLVLLSLETISARGRGKSAALGLAIAAAVAYGYPNILVTSPHPDNLATLFKFVVKGFKSLSYDVSF